MTSPPIPGTPRRGAPPGWSSRAATGGLVLTGVTMELAGMPGAPTAGAVTVVDDVTLSLSAEGVALAAPPPTPPASLPWSQLMEARCGEPGLLSDGSPAVAISAVVAGRMVRWLVSEAQMPHERAVAIDVLLATRTGRRDGGLAGTSTARSGAAAPAPAAAGAPAPAAAGAPAPAAAGAPAPAPDPAASPPPPLSGLPPRPSPASRHHTSGLDSEESRFRGIAIMWTAAILLALLGIAVLVLGLVSETHPPPLPHASPNDQEMTRLLDRAHARAANLKLGDLPSGWTVAETPKGPLSGLLAGAGFAQRLPGTTGVRSQVARQFERCTGVPRSDDVLFRSALPAPVVHAHSPAFAGPSTGPLVEAASLSAVYSSASTVGRGRSELDRSAFASCFGTAIGKEFRQSAQASSAGANVGYGTPKAVRLALPQGRTAHANGLDVELPLRFGGNETTVQFGFVFVTAGRVEATLVTFGTAAGFPTALTRSLTSDLEKGVGEGLRG